MLELVRQVRSAYPQKTIWAYSGYLLEDMLAKKLGPWEITSELLSLLDVLVDGEFVAEKKNLSLRFRGSSNQRIIDLPATLSSGRVQLWDETQ